MTHQMTNPQTIPDIVSLYQYTRNLQNSDNNCDDTRNLAYNLGYYSQIDVSNFPKSVLKMTVGKKGHNFIKKTEQNNLLSIWWDSTSNIIEFWGNNYNHRLNAIKDIQYDLYHNLYY